MADMMKVLLSAQAAAAHWGEGALLSFNGEETLIHLGSTVQQQDILRNRFDRVEGASGFDQNDLIQGDDRAGGDLEEGVTLGQNETNFAGHELTQEGINRIDNLRAVFTRRAFTTPEIHVVRGVINSLDRFSRPGQINASVKAVVAEAGSDDEGSGK